jgi:hypothetical protein
MHEYVRSRMEMSSWRAPRDAFEAMSLVSQRRNGSAAARQRESFADEANDARD